MNEMPSSQFRKDYAKLEDETVVTVNGHIIGRWTPFRLEKTFDSAAVWSAKEKREMTERVNSGDFTEKLNNVQAARDNLLRKINGRK
jgi:hypothetical protein